MCRREKRTSIVAAPSAEIWIGGEAFGGGVEGRGGVGGYEGLSLLPFLCVLGWEERMTTCW